MKAGEWKRASGVLAEVLPEYRPIRFGFVRCAEWIASGFYADTSAFSSSAFYLQAFVMPRFVPAESIYFDYGFRVNGQWEEVGLELTDAVAAAEQELAERATLEALLLAASDPKRNINHAEVRLGIAAIRQDDWLFDGANRAVSDFAPELPWEAEVRARCIEFAALVQMSGYSAGQAELAKRQAEVDGLFASAA